MIKISVIIPFYNSEDWLERCACSLANQEGDFEFIFVNDNSTDNGSEIIKRYVKKDSRFILLDNKRPPGVSGARNTGLDFFSGDYVTFLDADDEYLPDAYITFTTAIKNDSGANIYQFNHIRYFAEKNKTVKKYINLSGVYDTSNLPEAWYGVWNKLLKAEFAADIRFKEGMQYGEDAVFVLECLSKGKEIHHAPKSFMIVKHNFINKSSLSKSRTREDLIKQVREYEKFMLEQQDPNLRKSVCLELSRLWGSITYLKVFGE